MNECEDGEGDWSATMLLLVSLLLLLLLLLVLMMPLLRTLLLLMMLLLLLSPPPPLLLLPLLARARLFHPFICTCRSCQRAVPHSTERSERTYRQQAAAAAYCSAGPGLHW